MGRPPKVTGGTEYVTFRTDPALKAEMAEVAQAIGMTATAAWEEAAKAWLKRQQKRRVAEQAGEP